MDFILFSSALQSAGTRTCKEVKIFMTTALNDMKNVAAAFCALCNGYLA